MAKAQTKTATTQKSVDTKTVEPKTVEPKTTETSIIAVDLKTPENEKIISQLKKVNLGMRVDLNRPLAIIGSAALNKNKQIKDDERANTVTISFAKLDTANVNTLQKRYYNMYRNYTKSGFKTLNYIKIMKADHGTYDLTKLINESFANFTTECLRNMNIIDKNNKILDQKAFDEISDYLVIKLDTPKLSTVKTEKRFTIYDERDIRKAESPFHSRVLEQDNGEKKVIQENGKFSPFTTDKILPIAEKVMGCKFEEDPFAFAFAM